MFTPSQCSHTHFLQSQGSQPLVSSNTNPLRFFTALRTAFFPASPKSLTLRLSLVRTGLTFSASAIALAPSSPMLLFQRLSLVRTGLTFSASAIA